VRVLAREDAVTPGALQLLAPAWLWLLPALALAALAWRRRANGDEDGGLAAATPGARLRVRHPLAYLLPGARLAAKRSRARALVAWTVLACLVLALSQPIRIGEQLPEPPSERDIVFIVDTSVSMILRDYVFDGERIDRMTLLKGLLDGFARRLEGDRIGVIVFADAPYTMVPLTPDIGLVRRMLTRITTGIAGRSGAVGDAVALAVREAQRSAGRRPILVLFTDAALPTSRIEPEEAAGLAARAGVALYTVAIGAASREAEERRAMGLIYHPANVALLKAMAERTGARSYQAGDTDALQHAIDDIGRRETTARTLPPRYYREPLYHWPLLFGLALLTLYQCARLLRGQSR
jgi:Ca-activated chloride channel family protein